MGIKFGVGFVLMNKMNYLNNIKDIWGIESNFQFIIIFIVFSCITGSMSLLISGAILEFVNPRAVNYCELGFINLRIIIILIIYQLLLIVVGIFAWTCWDFKNFIKRNLKNKNLMPFF